MANPMESSPWSVFPFDLTLVWPMRLTTNISGSFDFPGFEKAIRIDGSWIEEDDLIRRNPPSDLDGYAHGEWNYFHPFIQRLLYRRPDKGGAFWIFRRSQVEVLKVRDGNWREDFLIREVLLYVLPSGLAVMKVELEATQAVTWQSAQDSLSYLRRLWAPHYYRPGENKAWVAGGVKGTVWIEPLQAEPGEQAAMTVAASKRPLTNSLDSQIPRLLPHWEDLLDPVVWCEPRTVGISAQPLGDSRMGAMLFLGTDRLMDVTEDDWFALSEADHAGSMRYSPQFRDEALGKACYDRWWQKWDRGRPLWTWAWNHRYLVGPLTFISAKQVPLEDLPPYLSNLREKWRRNYFQLFLIANIQRHELLILQDEVLKVTREGKLDQVNQISRKIAVFSATLWYREITPQIQGQELFERLQEQMRIPQLFREVVEDKAHLTNWAREEWRDRVTRIAVFSAGLSLAAGILGMNVIFRDDVINTITKIGWVKVVTPDLVLLTAVCILVTLGGAWAYTYIRKRS
ncbi:MAG: hypothetical protein JNK87_06445 [Bryobacterales bacterium]|nr:hypothetical protein [Bryobacterales bacterium]